ncbi:MAG: tyrosine--tRNA ligase [Deltaproteobacteria bacterium]|nr:tyrosine--tRNA ligase [Deltaproteobacteria bacterium]MBW1919044.1 tyrosine--tRNA ligase [Deltaproteobacteria bacterium]MBW1934535.1 tyrosine--tRNA ligase [Deltaproteobacteria bacterium]MBW1977021.1 tyrosine--tRNA ligase [Deltaproteobacteria bacterium]MBW2044072.1 tyrosine--tRNA ligase [Deltaproteobacteria bacterium]
MENVFDTFEKRGFVEQVTDRDQLRKQLQNPTTCYIGFDPTASSLHLGSLVPVMALAHMQRAGHRPIAVVGGGTTLVGDPSGKTETRRIMTREEINRNAEGIREQLSRFIDFSNGKALMVNNADWLTKLNYIDFLRDIGCHFSVNRMLAAESYRVRLETGLSFIEFNYMLLQAYDYWHLFKHFNCRLQMGGNDQWGNILAGVDLIRRLEGEVVHALTFPLITTSAGIKMGKTHKGAIWLDKKLTSPYEYYQYWINQDDRDIERFLALFTFLPMEEVKRLGSLRGEEIKKAKEVLAYEATLLCHGKEEAEKAREASRQLFGGEKADLSESVPTQEIAHEEIKRGIPAYLLFEKGRLCKTRGEARRLISQGGGYVNDRRIESFDQVIDTRDLRRGSILLRAGKKRYLRIVPRTGE